MKYGIRLIEYLERRIINELQNEIYNIDSGQIQRIHNIYDHHCAYYYYNQTSGNKPCHKKTEITLFKDNGDLLRKDMFIITSKTIDILPLFQDGKMIKVQPLLFIEHFEKIGIKELIPVIMHEICHLFSIGEYYEHDSVILHNWGLNLYTYKSNNNKLSEIDHTEHQKLNEIVNDCISIYFVNQLFHFNASSIYSGGEYYSNLVNFIYCNINTIINLYFSERSLDLAKLLYEYTYIK